MMEELATLIGIAPPPFISIHDPTSIQTTANSVRDLLSAFSDNADSPTTTDTTPDTPTAHIRCAIANGISCFTPRLLYDRIINSLARWTPKWEDGCANWCLPLDSGSDAVSKRWNDSFDAFIHGLRALHQYIQASRRHEFQKVKEAQEIAESKAKKAKGRGRSKGKGKQKELEEDLVINEDVRFFIVIEHAERLQETMPDLVVPLTRLAELTQLDLTVAFLSQVRWEDMKPAFGASLDPYFIDVPPPKKEDIVKVLEGHFDEMARVTTQSTCAPSSPFDNHATPKSKRGRNTKNTTQSGPSEPTQYPPPGPYHPSLRQLYSHFASVICDVCYPFTHDPREIQYIAAARWPGFAQPVLDEHAERMKRIERKRARREKPAGSRHNDDMDVDDDADEEYDEGGEDDGEDEEDEDDQNLDLLPPTEDARMRLSRLFKPTLTVALEDLYPRLTNAAAWARLNSAPPDPDSVASLSRPSSPVKMGGGTGSLASEIPVTPRTTRVLRSSVPNTPHTPRHSQTPHTSHTPYTPRTPRVTSYTRSYANNQNQNNAVPSTGGLSVLPRMSKFILLAAFLASTNPAKSDVRMFGRGADEKKRKRRRAGSMGGSKTKTNGVSKVPQRLLGPTPFPLDRLIAILGSLLEENDVDEGGEPRLSTDELFAVPGEYTDMEISRVGVYAAIVELSSVWLLHRTSPPEKLEGPPVFKCGISYEDALGLAKELDVPLNDLLWDPV